MVITFQANRFELQSTIKRESTVSLIQHIRSQFPFPCCFFASLLLAVVVPAGSSDRFSLGAPIQYEQQPSPSQESASQIQASEASVPRKLETATFGAGCFWCVEAVFTRLKGVESVKSGYMGGTVPNPSYQQVCTGMTGHAEVIQIEYDPEQISFAELLEVFWKTHDPTTLNQQGNDHGTQYRSAVFFHSDDQRTEAEHYKKKLTQVKAFRRPIVTEIVPATEFYVAEDYHQEYFKNNPRNPYCRAVIPPKLKKLKAAFGDKLKEDPRKSKGSKTTGSKSK
jgi:peptide-methionine (S)-S-oxide reductase